MPFVKASDVFGDRASPEFFAEFEQGQLRCSACDQSIRESITGCRKMGDGAYCCSDCYYRAMGDALEGHPVLPRRLMRRG